MILFSTQASWVTVLTAALILPTLGASPALNYNRDIRPILSDNCFACHGPDQSQRKARLRLDVREQALARQAIVPGNADESELVARIFATDEDDLMPPPKSHKTLTAAEKDLLRRWVMDGAEYEGHWAYTPPAKFSIPAGRDAIDFLVRRRLEAAGLEPSPEADRRTLARRLYSDLVGLPPKPEEWEAFERDTAPDAYANVVERLLASPQYGERMALGWLDVVRYADTIGYHSDNPRNIWPYRDYVIQSFNENKPFDQFTREQLAGDLLPNSSLQQKVASGFNRLLLTTEEGGAQPKDYETRMLTDRVRAVGSVWLGQTLGCAQCHDHKFDPITARDFYAMGAFFADLKEPIVGRREEGLLVPSPSQAAQLEKLEAELTRARQQYEMPRLELLASWEAAAVEAIRAERSWTVLKPEEAVADHGVKLRVDFDGMITAQNDPEHGIATYRITVRPGLSGLTGFRVEALSSESLPAHGPGRARDGSFVLTEFAVEDMAGHALELADATATFESSDAAAWTALGRSEAKGGWAVRELPGVPQAIYFAAQEPIDTDEDGTLTLSLKQRAGGNAVLGRFRMAATTDPAALRAPRTTLPPRDIAGLLMIPSPDRRPEDTDKLAAYHRGIAPELAATRQALALARKGKAEFEATLPRTLIAVAMDSPRTVRILPRGDWMIETGEIVQPALPAYLPAAVKGQGSRLSRLDLAEWLVARDNPLTARVVINRVWKQFFGTGLSKVLDDFGAQGEAPPNPELLDWLACEFMESGWDVKHMVRLMVNSQTYRQVSTASRELLNRDPENRELARQSRWRLEAELVRDQALSIAGLLAGGIGGPSFKPYQPEGYWENLNFPVRSYEASPGEEQYRRGLYTWWQRSFLHPGLLAFDAPTREECAAERARSNIPQQALVLLNDPSYVEAARVFAARILQEGGADATSRITWAWRQTLSRVPRPDELETVQELLDKQLSQYRSLPEAASLLLQVGLAPVPKAIDPAELAAWTSVARVLINLHETLTRS